jgi:hypothetical protein
MEIKGVLNMIDKNKMVKVINKFNGTVGYDVPEMGIHRNFYPKESKEISFEELERLSFVPGGDSILRNYLEIVDEDAIMALFNEKPEPEYHYSENDVKQLLTTGTLDQFLDCLDFAPDVIKDMIKDLAVELPLNDMAKRQAIQDKLGFDVTKAIEIKNTKYDGETEETTETKVSGRRTAPIKSNNIAAAPSGRRYNPIKSE